MDEPELHPIENEDTETHNQILNQTIEQNPVTSASNMQERILEDENVPIKLFSPTSLREQNIRILAENLTQIIISNSVQVCREKRFTKNFDSASKMPESYDKNGLEILTEKVVDVISNACNDNDPKAISDLAVNFVENVINDAHFTVQNSKELKITPEKIAQPAIESMAINLAGHSRSNPPVANESKTVLTGIEKINMHPEMKKDVNSQDKVFSTIPGGEKNQKDRNAFGCVREEMDLNKIAQQEVEKAIQQAIETIQDQKGMILL